MRIGYKIRKLRELRNYTQEYVASKLRMSTCNYSKLERDEISITLNRLQEISIVLGCTLIDVISLEENKFFGFQDENPIGKDIIKENNYCFSEQTSSQLEEVIIRLQKIEEILKTSTTIKTLETSDRK